MSALREALVQATRLIADALEKETPVSPPTTRYYCRATAPVEARAWDRAVKEIPTFKPGRALLVLAADLHAWIERHPISRKPAADVADDDPIDFAEFKRTALRPRRVVK